MSKISLENFNLITTLQNTIIKLHLLPIRLKLIIKVIILWIMYRSKMSLHKKKTHPSLSKVIKQIINRLVAIIQQIQTTLLMMVQILKITLLAIIQILLTTIPTHQTQLSKKIIIRIHLNRLEIVPKNKLIRLKIQVTSLHQSFSLLSTWLFLFPRSRNLLIGIVPQLRWTL